LIGPNAGRRTGLVGYSDATGLRASLRAMDPKSAAEDLPALYRAILDRIAQIDAAGERSVGYRIRAEATRIYSRAWDERARRGLEALLRQTAEQAVAQRGPVRGSSRRSAPVA
jgi:hypothetical protein